MKLRGWTATLALVVAATSCHLTLGFGDKVFCEEHPDDPVCKSGGGGSGGGVACDQADLFGDSLESSFELDWTLFEPTKLGATGFGTCIVEDTSNCFWMENQPDVARWDDGTTAPFYYQTLCGNFAMWAHVELSEPDGESNATAVGNSGAALLVRDASLGNATHVSDEHWAMLSLGNQAAMPVTDGMGAIEYGVAVWARGGANGGTDGSSPIQVEGFYKAELMICRANGEWRFLSRAPGGPVQVHQLPPALETSPLDADTVQAGFTVYASDSGGVVRGWFDYVFFNRVGDLSECASLFDAN